jgi:uncharacterized membrane protein YjjB (DUF3815 family)
MDYILQLVCAFVATYGIAIIFNAPKSTLKHCGLVGMIGWLIYYALIKQEVDSVTASFCGSFIISIVAHYQSFKHKTPMLIFVVGGIIPLVPGGLAYEAMRHVVANEYNESLQFFLKTGIITGAIVMGLVIAEVLVQMYRKMIRRFKKVKTFN